MILQFSVGTIITRYKDFFSIHVDNFFFGGTEEFITKVINPIHEEFVIGSEYHTAFKYLGLNEKHLGNYLFCVDQIPYTEAISCREIKISSERKSVTESPLTEVEIKNF